MSHVANINGMIARRVTQVVVAHGLVTGAASCLREVRHSHLSRTCAARYRVEVATLRSQGVQRRNRKGHARQVPATTWRPWRYERPFMLQPAVFNKTVALALRAICGVRLLTKGMAIWARTRYWRSQPFAGSAQLSRNRGRYQWRGFAPHHRSLLRPIAARIVAFLASHPAKPSARPCGTCSGLP